MSFPKKTNRTAGEESGKPAGMKPSRAKRVIPVGTQEPAKPRAKNAPQKDARSASRRTGRWMPPWKKWKLEREEKKRREEEERRRKEEEERERTRQMLKKYGPAMLGFLTVLVLITVPLGIRSERQKNEVAAVNDLTRSAIVLSEQDRSPADKTDAPETGAPPEDAPADEPAPERGAEQDDGTQPQDGAGPEQDGA